MYYSKSSREKDACAIIAFVDKKGKSTHATIVRTIDALRKMGHRSGDINGEGDGCGILTDIPRQIWGRRLEKEGISRHLAESRMFFVGHFLLPISIRHDAPAIIKKIQEVAAKYGADILLQREGQTKDEELGPRAKAEAPLFYQIAGIISRETRREANKDLFKLHMEIDSLIPDIHVASLSLDSVVYKLRGAPELLSRVYPELVDPDNTSVIALGHSRYSTNTLPTVERAQPFSVLGHNGEINTIERLRSTGKILGIDPVPGGSDSQDLNRILEGLINLYDLEPIEAMEMMFPTIHSEVEKYPKEYQELYSFYRWFFPCSAQGPAAVVARFGNVCMGSVDALGLRPLWFGESSDNFFLSSEKGVVDLKDNLRDPRPLAPGEKVAIVAGLGKRAEILDYTEIQSELVKLMESRKGVVDCVRSFYHGLPDEHAKADYSTFSENAGEEEALSKWDNPNMQAAFGWQQYDIDMRRRVAKEGREIVGSMGHTGPLAAINPDALPNIAEYFKENVAVVTNPAIDREREAEHFTTRVILGDRPDMASSKMPSPVGVEVMMPVLLGGGGLSGVLDQEEERKLATQFGTCLLEDVLDFFTGQAKDMARVKVLDATFDKEGDLHKRLDELSEEARSAVKTGAVILVADDARSFKDGRVYVDPSLLVAYILKDLEKHGLRRSCSLIVRSAAIRNLHDVMFLMGLGADALNPYMLWRLAASFADDSLPVNKAVANTLSVMQKGIEKVMSTMGIHELCGYGRVFASIGLKKELEDVFQIPNFCSSEKIGLGYAEIRKLAVKRYERASLEEPQPLYKDPKRNPRVGKILRSVALGKKGYSEMAKDLKKIEEEMPAAIRHTLDIKQVPLEEQPVMDEVDISVGRHDMPLVIAAMSFGSQGENSFRAYAEAAKKVNIICMNGEGGEIPDMLGKYRHNRGQQIASGRFGVYMHLLNSTDYLEIKIGQGAKPGEGGHLPGVKVSERVAEARHCKPGITLISPSNQHDIYSIEDLAQIITELKTANPYAKVSVKIPVTSGVGTIAVGIAKAGADIVNLSGFEGGTGAAREHAKRYVGLPAEVGVSETHRALVESGLREQVEVWCDGGIRSGLEAVKMILMGADRIGLGTVALMGVGCISCQRCHLDRCPRGISTQLQTKKDAEGRGVKGFVPRQSEIEAENLARLLRAIGDEMKMVLCQMGQTSLRALVGRTDLLEQVRFLEYLDTTEILRKPAVSGLVEESVKADIVRRPLNFLTRLISDIVMERFDDGANIVYYSDHGVRSTDRAVGTYLAGAMVRKYDSDESHRTRLRLESSVPGNGLCAFNIPNIDIFVGGGAQDGAAKGAFGGILGILKGLNRQGKYIDGSAGKSLAYGAISGTLLIQNYADSRACVRLSGADVVFGARITNPVQDDKGNIASRAHLKGFAFEYMTGGRIVVLGDPGPWICAGMTGGVIYQCLYPDLGFDKEALNRRLARGANVNIRKIDDQGYRDVEELLGIYINALKRAFQYKEAEKVAGILAEGKDRFVMIVPKSLKPPSAE